MKFIYLIFLSISFILGQYSIIHGYDPRNLEKHFLANARQIYTIGCMEGIKLYAGQSPLMIDCLDLSFRAIQNQEDIFKDKAWEK